jgi:hypothetical protein
MYEDKRFSNEEIRASRNSELIIFMINVKN